MRFDNPAAIGSAGKILPISYAQMQAMTNVSFGAEVQVQFGDVLVRYYWNGTAWRPTSGLPSVPFASFNKPFAADSLWNSRPVNPQFDKWKLPVTAYNPVVDAGAYSCAVFLASSTDTPMTVTGLNGTPSTLWLVEAQVNGDITIPRWPAETYAAAGTDGHSEIFDPILGVIHSFWQLQKVGNQWRAAQYAAAPIAGTGWGTPGEYQQGARSAGICTTAGMIRAFELDDGDAMFRHALAMSLDFSGLDSNPSYVFPATNTDAGAENDNFGQVPIGSLMMLPASFDTSVLANRYLRKVAETLKVYGARVVDRNTSTRYNLYVELGSGFNLTPNGFDNAINDQLVMIADALRRVDAEQFIDGYGVSFVPSQNINMLSMRGPWNMDSGSGSVGVFNVFSKRVEWAGNDGTLRVQSNGNNNTIGSRLWSSIVPGESYRLTGKASAGAKVRIQMMSAANSVLLDTGYVGNNESVEFVAPVGYTYPRIFAQSGNVSFTSSSVSGELVHVPASSAAANSAAPLGDYSVLRKQASANSYDFPLRVRPQEKSRRSVVIRNLGATDIQVAYAALDAFSYNSPAASAWTSGTTIPAGRQSTFAGTAAMFARPATSGQGMLIGVFTSLGEN